MLPAVSRRCAIGAIALCIAVMPPGLAAQTQPPVRVFISVDMEGLAGVVSGSDVSSNGPDYPHFRTIMAGETNAAIEGAFRGGATEVVVRDSHGSKQNLLPSDLDARALLLRGVSTGPRNMMEGIDSTFAAVVFIGYHARAGTPQAILEHTSTGNVIDFAINGVSLPEGGYNAMVAGLVGVPVVFVSGDMAVVAQIDSLLSGVDGFAVKRAVNGAILGLSPREAQEGIRVGVERGVRSRGKRKPYAVAGPYSMVLRVKNEKALYPGAVKTAPGTFAFSSPDLLEVLNAFNAMK